MSEYVKEGYPDKRQAPSLPDQGPADSFDAKIPDPPSHIDRAAKKIFKRVAEALAIAGQLRNVDWLLLGELAQAASDVARLTREVRKEGEMLRPAKKGKAAAGQPPGGTMYWNPKNGLLKEARKRLQDLSDRFGVNPKARAALKFPTGDTPPDTDEDGTTDQMELFIKGEGWNKPDEKAG